MKIYDSKKIAITGAFSIIMLLATMAAAYSADYTPGKVNVAKGTVEVTSNDVTARTNPNRPLRTLAYQMGTRQAYREGNWDYYNRRKIAREETTPAWGAGIQGPITGKKTGSFVKTAPQLYPYQTASGLRATIQTMPTKKLSSKLAVIKQISSSTTQGGE